MVESNRLAEATEARRDWAEANRKAAAAEERMLRAAVRYVRGEGPEPNVVLKEHALLLRREANALRPRQEGPNASFEHAR
jgi:hypothetical protein